MRLALGLGLNRRRGTPIPVDYPVLTSWDYYVSESGDDGNDGTTPGTAWRSMDRISTMMAAEPTAGGDTVSVHIAAGTYDGGINVSVAWAAAKVLNIDCQEGVTWQKGVSSTVSATSAGGSNLTLNIIGRGCVITDFLASSGNGLAANNTATLNAWDVEVTNCDDGASAHSASTINLYRCKLHNCTKGAFVSVDTSANYLEDCILIGRTSATAGIGQLDSTATANFLRCSFTPATAGQSMSFGGTVEFDECVIGTTSLRVDLGNRSNSNNLTFIDSYVNVTGDGMTGLTMTRCYGKFASRIRGNSSSATGTFDHCVFVGPPTGSTTFMDGSFDAGDGNWLGGAPTFIDSVITGYTYGFSQASAAQIAHMNSNWTASYLGMYNNSSGNFETGLTFGANTVTTDPSLGVANTTTQSDYEVTGGDYIGGASDGGNIGFAAGDYTRTSRVVYSYFH